MFYKWTLLLSLCSLIVLGQESHSPTQGISWKLAEMKVNKFKLKLHKTLETLATTRKSFVQGKLELRPVITARPVETRQETITQGCTAKMDGTEIIFAVTASNTLSILKDVEIEPIASFPADQKVISLQAFEYGNVMWLITHLSKGNSQYIQMWEFAFSTSSIVPRLKVDLRGPSIVASTKVGYVVYIAVTTKIFSNKLSEFKLFRWTGTEFDKILSDQIYNEDCSGLLIWKMEETIYIALSFAKAKMLLIKRFMENTGTSHNLQLLDIEAHIIKYFNYADNYYLACGTRDAVVIYRWTGSSFIKEFTKAFDNPINDIVIHSISEKIIVAVVFSEEVKFLVQESSPQYVMAGNIDLRPIRSLKSVLLWKNKTLLYMLSLSEENLPYCVHAIALKFKIPDRESQHQLKECLGSLSSRLNERQKEIDQMSSVVKKTWPSSKEIKIASLKINGTVKSFKNVTFNSLQVPSVSSLVSIRKMSEEITHTAEQLMKELKMSVSKSKYQFLENRLVFKNLVVEKGTIFQLKQHVNLNNLNTVRLPFTLKKRGHQTFEFYRTVANVVCRTATVTAINSKMIEDYWLLNADSMIATDWFKFSNVSVKTMIVNSSMINGIDIDDFVLISSKQDVIGMKTFNRLSSEVILTEKRVGEMQFGEIRDLVASLDPMNFKHPLRFTSDLIIQGNLDVIKLNGYDMLYTYSKFVKKNEEQVIQGKKLFKSVNITGNLHLLGELNSCSLNHLMTTGTDQTIYSAVTFNITHFKEILTDSTNGIDLSEQAFIKSRDNKVKGLKNFRRTLAASNIIMKEGTLLDSFDPSAETSEIVYKSDSADGSETYFNKSVTIENVIVENLKLDTGSFPLLDDFKNVWLKTTEQNITSLNAEKMTINMLDISKVNGIAIEDLIPVHGSVNANGLKFNGHVFTKSLNLAGGSTFNLTLPPLNPCTTVKIMNNITLESAVVEGNLSIDGFIQGAEKGFMHIDKIQTLRDIVEFERVEMKELNLKNLEFQLLNKTNFTEYLERSVIPFKNTSVSNKHFKHLKGAVMISNGMLNGVSLDRLVTINTNQKIASPWKFTKDVSFDKMLAVKKFFDGFQLEDVVFTDKTGTISHKHFNGNVTTTHMNTRGYINGVNITLMQLSAFNKTKNNAFEEKISFLSNVTAGQLQVFRSKIDNVDLEHLIRLDGSVQLGRMKAASIIVINATVKGLINRCPWMQIFDNALLLRKFPRNVTSRIFAKSLVIDGNLNLVYLNGAKIPAWISLLTELSSPDFNGNVTFENIKADVIQLQNPVNNVSMDFLVSDAVRKSTHQIITSQKSFRKVNVKIVTIDRLNSNKTCGFNISEMTENFLSRNLKNEIVLEIGSLGGLLAEKVTIEGKLNYLKLPDDVVLVNTTELIEDEVLINNTVNVAFGFNVTGNINDIKLEHFLEKRVTLNASEKIFSSLIFMEDLTTHENMVINGTINNIFLDDIVKKQLQNQAVNGTKNFTEDVQLSDHLEVNGTVNDAYFDQILRSSREEAVKYVNFSALNVSSLTCGTINGVNVTDFYEQTHEDVHDVNDKLHDYTAEILSYQESLRARKEFFENQLFLFNYFELHEVLKYRKIQRFLPVYEYGVFGEKYQLHVTQMVIWVANEHHCRKTKSLIADVSQNGTFNVTKMMKGKIFPFSLRIEKEDVVGFNVQAKESRRCLPGMKKLISIKTMYSSGLIRKETITSPQNSTLVDVQLLELDEIFLVTAYNIDGDTGRIFVHLYNVTNNTWSNLQTFHTENLTSMDFISIERDTDSFFDPPTVYLSVTGTKSNPGVTIYEWDFEMDEFYFKSNMSTSVSSYALWVDYEDTLHLLLAKEVTRIRKNTTWVNIFTEPLEVYTFDEEELILNHTVPVKGIRSLEMFILADEAFVLASSNHMETVYVLKFRGYNGFEIMQEIPAPGVTEACVFTVHSDLYLALNSLTGQSRILKATVRGGRLDFH